MQALKRRQACGRLRRFRSAGLDCSSRLRLIYLRSGTVILTKELYPLNIENSYMKVLLAELGGSHIEVLYTLVHVLHMKGHEVFLACNKNLAGLIREKEKLSGIFLLPDDIRGVAMQVQALRTIRGAIRDNHIDTLILGTTEIKPVRYLLPFLPRVNIIGIVHNSAKLNSSAAFKYFYPIRIRKYFVLGDYIRRNITGLSEERVFAYYPVYFPKPVDRVALTKPSHEKWIIIPGAVRSERKDYILLLRKIHEHGLPENIRLVLLGKSYEGEREIDALIRGVNAREERIVTFDEYLDFDTFHEYLSKADFVLPLLKITADLFYDDKRISGAFNLAYGYRLPLLLPGTFRKNTDPAPFAIYYRTIDELYEIFRSASRDDLYASAVVEAYARTERFDLDDMADRLVSFIQGTAVSDRS